MQTSRTEHEQQQQAYELGAEHARNAASWVIDGNTPHDQLVCIVRMMDDGDPELHDHLPREPNLSGEFADDPTPQTVFAHVFGRAPISAFDGLVMASLADAYEQGVSDTFLHECERILRAAL